MSFMIYFLSMNVLSFFLCFWDKKRAIHHKWRIAENTLLLVSFVGGCFGMFIGMYLFHHKTKKLKFKLVPVSCVIWIFYFFLENI